MKTTQTHPRNIFTGKWRIVSLYGNIRDRGWTLFKSYSKNVFTWEFREEEELVDESGTADYGGVLIEHYINLPPSHTTYCYYPENNLLLIDRSQFQPDALVNVCISDKYMPVYVRDNEYWLYVIEDSVQMPGQCDYRIKIKKLSYLER